jgi:hypothetical protein
MITADGQGYAPEPEHAHPVPGFTPPLPHDDDDPQDWVPAPRTDPVRHQTVRDWRGGAPRPYGPSEPEPEHEPRQPIDMDRAYQWERLALRVIAYALYLFGVIGYALWAADWTSWLALILGGLLPVAYLLGTESHERMIEADRKANAPERRAGDLPHLRRAEHRGYDDDPADGR